VRSLFRIDPIDLPNPVLESVLVRHTGDFVNWCLAMLEADATHYLLRAKALPALIPLPA
jgi:hypothetical protein